MRRHTYTAVACKLISGLLTIPSKIAESKERSQTERHRFWNFTELFGAAGAGMASASKGRMCVFCLSVSAAQLLTTFHGVWSYDD